MITLGYALSSEEHKPNQLVAHAQMAEQVGFKFLLISDHFHPWVPQQGQSSFVWSVLGGIAHATQRVQVGTGVTCPIMRIHPALVAQAAATVADMMPGRFFLGLGTGEYLNEHILGEVWPEIDVRQDMLAEAVHIIRELWKGEEYSYHGTYFTVRDARIYTLPDELPPIYIAASGPKSAELAGEISEGLISTTPDDKVVNAFKEAGGTDKPCFGMVKVCWAHSAEEARATVKQWWPTSAVSGPLHSDLPTPRHFEDVVEAMGDPIIPEDTVLGPNPNLYLKAIQTLQENGFDHIYLHQIGPDQEGFLKFFKSELYPLLEKEDVMKEVV
ncbi:MAG TPA: TIGR03557 family F420-dependent LLM class oxidoreductase [Anaerolineales bacterium]|nr:TIGR03557 family F420-dependent LLM class oxidoreductase [Anaerolineales bacterium]